MGRGYATTAVLVLVGCALGAAIGTWLAFPGLGAAALFPPYAIVTAALWRTPPRHWWIILVAATVGDLVPHLLSGASLSFALSAELVNHARAVIATLAFHRFNRSGRVATMRDVIAFLVIVVFAAPSAAAFGGAALVASHNAGMYWVAWEEWCLSNAITAVTLLPLFLVSARELFKPVRRVAEGLLLGVAFLGVGLYVFASTYDHLATQQTHLYWVMPFLLWAAVRFGLRGTSAVLLGVTLLSSWGAIEGRGPFAAEMPAENLLELEVFLLAVSIPVSLLAVLTEQQSRTAAELMESQRQYRSIVEDQTEMICRFRPDGTYTFANRAYCATFGTTAQDLAGASIWSAVPTGVHASLDAITHASPVATREVSVETREGTRWQQWRDRALFDDTGTIIEYQAVGRDITDRKRAEDEHHELEARKSVEAALREADRRKDEFLAMLGHELRNPLAPIGIALEILFRTPGGSDEADWARQAIKRQLTHMTRLLDDLLDISRITLGKIELRLAAVDLRTAIANAVEATRPFIDSLEHELVVDMPEKPLRIRGDGVRLTQIVANLLHNAAKYTERGGLVEVSATEDGGGVTLSVRDNGIGLAPESLETIFDLFAQIHAGGERAQGGLGIGLTLVKRLVELHGGTVEARSEGPSLGSEIIVRLPPHAHDAADAAPPVTQVREGRPLRILAVDDNADIADGLAAVLNLWGHTVRTANDGFAALQVASAFEPEVVLLDLGLPHMNGLEVARRLRRDAPILLVSMSGFGHETARRSSDEAGFHHHLVKPIDLDSLRALLDDSTRAKD